MSKKNLTTSQTDRQNILNNEFAIEEIKHTTNIKCVEWNGGYYLTKDLVAEFFNVDTRTIERYISKNNDELVKNGYSVLRGKDLQSFANAYFLTFATDINVGGKLRLLSVFDFKAFLNIAMLLSESEVAAEIRSMILDITIDLINKKCGGSTKYINQRDTDFIASFLQGENYRKEFTDSLKNYVDMGNIKYPIYTDKIYQSIFREKAREYKQVLKLNKKDKIRDTLYSEVITLIASYECGLAEEIKKESEKLGRKLTNWEVDKLFEKFESLPHWKPLINQARTKMASRDMALRDALHYKLEEYIKPLDKNDYDKFLGSASDELERLLKENQDVLKRLKEGQ